MKSRGDINAQKNPKQVPTLTGLRANASRALSRTSSTASATQPEGEVQVRLLLNVVVVPGGTNTSRRGVRGKNVAECSAERSAEMAKNNGFPKHS